MRYRRNYIKGGTYFFTVVTKNRAPLFNRPETVNLLRQSLKKTMASHPFTIDAFVLLPDHLHCIWALPENDLDFSTRWRLIKNHFTRHYCSIRESNSPWQKRFWEHTIRSDHDFKTHLDYIHYNPVKHGYVSAPVQWKYSSFHKHVTLMNYSENWGANETLNFGISVGME